MSGDGGTQPAAGGRRELGSPRDVRLIGLSNAVFYTCLSIIGGAYVLLILAMLAADAAYMTRETFRNAAGAGQPLLAALTDNPIAEALADPKIQYSVKLSLIACTNAAVISLIVAVPMGYLLARHQFPGKRLLDAILDIPIVLPPLVVGLSLLILFQFPPFAWFARSVVYQIPAVVIAVLCGLRVCRADDEVHF